MLTNALLPWLSWVRLDEISLDDDMITFRLTSQQDEAACPLCAHASQAIHSGYVRRIADLACAGLTVCLQVQVRKFFCRNRACRRKVFSERLATLVAPYARRTVRLQAAQRQLALEHGGEAAARTARHQGIPVSGKTLLRLVRQTPVPAAATPCVLGIDDWAMRKGQTYGTILVDLERHRPVDLLPDRSAESLAQWLQAHPGVAVISRDRANDYAEGATRGAPDAIQVADRFHLLQNLREVLQRLLERYPAEIRQAAEASRALSVPLPTVQTTAEPAVAVQSAPPPSVQAAATLPTLSHYEQYRQQRRTKRVARYEEVRQLHAQGFSLRQIAKQLHLHRSTVRRFVLADQFPEQATRCKRPSKLDRHLAYLEQQLVAGRDNAMQLWRELRNEHGYTGSRALISRWVAQHRNLEPAHPPGAAKRQRRGRPPKASVSSPVPPLRVPAVRQVAWYLICRPEELAADKAQFVEALRRAAPAVATAHGLAQAFLHMVRARERLAFDPWLNQVEISGLSDFQSFAAGLRRDYAAVAAALSLPFSNGQVEGQVTRLKLIKRSMYGRAKFDLLRHRVLMV